MIKILQCRFMRLIHLVLLRGPLACRRVKNILDRFFFTYLEKQIQVRSDLSILKKSLSH